jgi:hypothetical protein
MATKGTVHEVYARLTALWGFDNGCYLPDGEHSIPDGQSVTETTPNAVKRKKRDPNNPSELRTYCLKVRDWVGYRHEQLLDLAQEGPEVLSGTLSKGGFDYRLEVQAVWIHLVRIARHSPYPPSEEGPHPTQRAVAAIDRVIQWCNEAICAAPESGRENPPPTRMADAACPSQDWAEAVPLTPETDNTAPIAQAGDRGRAEGEIPVVAAADVTFDKRLRFDDTTLTIFLDGKPFSNLHPNVYALYKQLKDEKGTPITRANIRTRDKRFKGDKTVSRLRERLPATLKRTVKSGHAGYWLQLPEKQIRE